jgi:hypothetical protein
MRLAGKGVATRAACFANLHKWIDLTTGRTGLHASVDRCKQHAVGALHTPGLQRVKSTYYRIATTTAASPQSADIRSHILATFIANA